MAFSWSVVERGREIDFGHDFISAAAIDHQEIVGSDSPQTDRVGGIGLMNPVMRVTGLVHESFFSQECEDFAEVFLAEFFCSAEWQAQRPRT